MRVAKPEEWLFNQSDDGVTSQEASWDSQLIVSPDLFNFIFFDRDRREMIDILENNQDSLKELKEKVKWSEGKTNEIIKTLYQHSIIDFKEENNDGEEDADIPLDQKTPIIPFDSVIVKPYIFNEEDSNT